MEKKIFSYTEKDDLKAAICFAEDVGYRLNLEKEGNTLSLTLEEVGVVAERYLEMLDVVRKGNEEQDYFPF